MCVCVLTFGGRTLDQILSDEYAVFWEGILTEVPVLEQYFFLYNRVLPNKLNYGILLIHRMVSRERVLDWEAESLSSSLALLFTTLILGITHLRS